jgi:hypothetical protein
MVLTNCLMVIPRAFYRSSPCTQLTDIRTMVITANFSVEKSYFGSISENPIFIFKLTCAGIESRTLLAAHTGLTSSDTASGANLEDRLDTCAQG